MISAKQAKAKSDATLAELRSAAKRVFLPEIEKVILEAVNKGYSEVSYSDVKFKARDVDPVVEELRALGYNAEPFVDEAGEIAGLDIRW